MKKCPFCETENEDSMNECVFCGAELPSEETNTVSLLGVDAEGALYSVLMLPSKHKDDIKTVQAFLKIGGGEAKKRCAIGQIDGLTQAEAETLAVKLRDAFFPTRVVKTSLVAEYRKGLSKDKSWEIKLLFGEENPAVIDFFVRYFDLDAPTVKEHLYFSIHDGDGTIHATDCKAEAEELAVTLRALGAEVAITEGEALK